MINNMDQGLRPGQMDPDLKVNLPVVCVMAQEFFAGLMGQVLKEPSVLTKSMDRENIGGVMAEATKDNSKLDLWMALVRTYGQMVDDTRESM